jgi:Flp pilus assembly protein TadB
LFRRTKSETSPESAASVESDLSGAAQKKGRPTPSRKEAEALNKARNKVPRTRKEQAEARRMTRGESSSKMRDAMKTGDERYLPARDKGPVRRFIRDYVDSRFSFIELLLPVMVVVLVLGWSGSPALASFANATLLAVLLVIVVEVVRMRLRLRKELSTRFPSEPQNGATYYAVMRSLQMRFMRMPRAQVKIGQQLPERYR